MYHFFKEDFQGAGVRYEGCTLCYRTKIDIYNVMYGILPTPFKGVVYQVFWSGGTVSCNDFGVPTYILAIIYRVELLYKVIMQYTHVLMCRDRMDGTLRGAMLLGIEHKGDYTLLKVGTTTFKNYYRGTPFIKIIVASLMLSELIKHPLTPIYTIGKVYSPKAYVLGLSMKEYHPVYNRETPEQYKRIFTEFAETYISSKAGRAKFNPETFVIEQEDSYVAENLTVLSEHELKNPHVKFFVERNPGWKKVE